MSTEKPTNHLNRNVTPVMVWRPKNEMVVSANESDNNNWKTKLTSELRPMPRPKASLVKAALNAGTRNNEFLFLIFFLSYLPIILIC